MNRSLFFSALPVVVLLAGATQAQSQEELAQRMAALEQKNALLEGRLEALANDQERFSLGELAPPIGEGRYGLGPAASKIYSRDEGLAIGGYGEALYQSRNGTGTDEIDLLRAVLYFGYHFGPNWVLNSEIEFEHAGEEVSVEFAYLDYLYEESLNFRFGKVIVPMGFKDELHEPNTFLTATRGEVEQRILPTTWSENGLGVFGAAGPVSYRAYVVNSFDATGFAADGLREGRQDGSEALAEDFAVVARADYTGTPGLLAGGSVYHGDSGQNQAGLGDTGTSIGELHVEWRAHGLWLRALTALAEVDDVTELNAVNGFTGAQSVGERLTGSYVEGGTDVLAWFAPESEMSLYPYARFEWIDTQDEVPTGFASDPANDSDVLTVGLHFQPIPAIVFKVEYQDFEDAPDGANVAMGYAF